MGILVSLSFAVGRLGARNLGLLLEDRDLLLLLGGERAFGHWGLEVVDFDPLRRRSRAEHRRELTFLALVQKVVR